MPRRKKGRSGRSASKGADGHEYRWDKVIGETEEAVQEVVKAIQAGKPVSRLTWKKFDVIKANARVPPKSTPGPGAYLRGQHMSGLGKQTMSHTRSAGSVHMGPSVPVKHVFKGVASRDGTRRVKVMPKHVKFGRGRPSSAQAKKRRNQARRDAKWKAYREKQLIYEQTKTVTSAKAKAKMLRAAKTYEDLPTTLGSNVSSKYGSAPSFSMKWRLEDLDLKRKGETPSGALVTNAFGPQLLSQYKSAGTMKFTTAPRANSRIQEDYISSLPAPSTYHPKYFAGTHRAPAYSIAVGVEPEFNPFRHSDVGPGSYDHNPAMGKQVSSMRRTHPAHRFGPRGEGKLDMDLQGARFEQAHERHQPLGVRAVHTRTFTNRKESQFTGTLKSLQRPLGASRTLAGTYASGTRVVMPPHSS